MKKMNVIVENSNLYYKSKYLIKQDDWIKMINSSDVFLDKDIKLLKQIYLHNDNHAATATELSLINGETPQSYNSPVICLAKRVLKYLNLEPEIRKNGKKIYWNVLFWGKNVDVKDHWEWKICPELEKAMEKNFKTLVCENIKIVNDELDKKLVENSILDECQTDKGYGYSSKIKEKTKLICYKGVETYLRDRQVALNALGIAKHVCEIDSKHPSFIRKRDGYLYTEPHHLIPMQFQNQFEKSIDIEENLVSLCSNCHNEIHYGLHADKLIQQLYKERHLLLKNKKVDITLEELLHFYGY